jgi:hypothetical protein
MNSAKPWYLSRTIWASIVTVISGGAGLVGVPNGVIDDGALADTILQLVTAISGLIAIFGRLSARDTIGRP